MLVQYGYAVRLMVLFTLVHVLNEVLTQINWLTMQVVPTIYTDIRGRTVHSNQVLLETDDKKHLLLVYSLDHFLKFRGICNVQYSVTEHFRNSEVVHFDSVSGVFFVYDLSPIKVGSFVNI